MCWICLFAAILLEVAATVCMKLSDGFSKLAPTLAMGVLYAMSFFPMTWALRQLDVSIAYAVWSAVGTALITIIGSVFFKELMTPAKMVAIAMIVVGVIALNLASAPAKSESDRMAAATQPQVTAPQPAEPDLRPQLMAAAELENQDRR